ncbi:tRNA (adenosine(37)-N6)-threonylcarbamoyltransferase complex ATPase subunit type 1 TsaE [Aureispira anguillae]|uniref:tRNA threonylcarbamoyladenosine biosynthesis protein TsaE n=1 Tax=Aureispira anguillae TaxID=2864201 RepID=A0A915YH30_9BACT|nr:tRNA (adenosine(37)-N6)-threonylcarbamoyltransferase complex ATPase subunit type 1 TsaE [Aureispira anguillae]BDS12953.1 tRNA (adenosine(37)-N6)-threonylcarbamoyltransferase complex ATPase subunit type 1 TsaE [Aureispira anguillae]
MRQQFLVATIDDLTPVVTTLLPTLKERKKVAFLGEIGAGKTTFIKLLCQALGVQDVTSSPTFSIINQYQSQTELVHHIDLYRLKSEEEAFSIGLMELLEDESYCFIEWPNIIESYFPEKAVWIQITAKETGVRIFDIFFE